VVGKSTTSCNISTLLGGKRFYKLCRNM